MGATGSELKRVRQSKRNNLRNKHYKSMMKTSIKNVFSSDKDNISENFKNAISTIDKVSSKGIIHKNNANRHKSKISKFVNNF